MPEYRQPVQEYMRACEALLKINELSNEEAEAVEECLVRLPINFSTDRSNQSANRRLNKGRSFDPTSVNSALCGCGFT